MSRDPVTTPPVDDADIAAWTAGLGLDGLIDLHVHFLPDQVMAKVWAYFDQAAERYGMPWPVHYRLPQDDRVAALRATQLQAVAGWAAADDRLGAAFLRAVVHDTPGRLLQLGPAGHQG